MCQTHSSPKAFVFVTSTSNALSPNICMACFPPPSGPCSNILFTREDFSDYSIENSGTPPTMDLLPCFIFLQSTHCHLYIIHLLVSLLFVFKISSKISGTVSIIFPPAVSVVSGTGPRHGKVLYRYLLKKICPQMSN